MGKIGKALALSLALIIVTSCLTLLIVKPVNAQSASDIVINPNGYVTGTYSIRQVGSTYTLTANLSGNIQIQKSGITIDGSGFSLYGGIDLTNGIGPNLPSPTRPEITNVTVKNLYVNGGIGTNGGGNDTFYNDVFSSDNQQQSEFSIQLLGCSYNNISYCSFDNGSQISMDYSAAFNTVTNCNLPTYGILIWLSGYETVDGNYWNDYSTKYPNATEIDHSGVGNQPYVYYSYQNMSPNGTNTTVTYQDNHPLMKPVTIPLNNSTTSPTPSVPELSWLVIAPLLLLLFSVAAIVKHRKSQQVKKH